MRFSPPGSWIARGLAGLCFSGASAMMVRSLFVTDDYALRGQETVMWVQSHEGFLSAAWTRPVRWPVGQEWKHVALVGNATNAAALFVDETLLGAHWHHDALGLDYGLLGFRIKELQQDRATMEVQIPYWFFAGLGLLVGLRRGKRAQKGPAFELHPLPTEPPST